MAFFGAIVNFITQKLKSKHVACLSFLWWQVFLREGEKIFYTYSGSKVQDNYMLQKQGYTNKLKNWFLDLTMNSAGSLKTFLYFPVLRYKKKIYPVKGSMSASMPLIEQDASVYCHQSPTNKVLQNTLFMNQNLRLWLNPGSL